ncbi:CzcA family heavy metal efflux pump [Bradyrhizobium sp. LB13.1]
MFKLIVQASLRNRLFVLAVAAVLVGYGLFVLPTVSVDVLPDINRPTVNILTEAEGLAPQEVEQLVTFPIETSMNGMPGVIRVRSVSGVGLSVVYVEFDWGVDVYRARQFVSERLALIREQLPSSVNPQMGPVTSIMGEIMLVALTSDGTATPMEVREIADFVVRPQLLAIPGVAQVIPIGGEVRQYRVTPNVATMQALSITHDQIEQAVAKFGTNSGGGFVDQHGREYLIRNVGLTRRIEDLGNTVVASRDGQPILLKQVASVDFAARTKRGDAGYNGKPAVIVSVMKQPAADTVVLTRNIEATLKDLQRTMRSGINVTNVQFRQATFIETSISNVERVLAEAAVVVALVLVVFLMNGRAAFVSLTAIPISILVTVLVFYAFGLTINTMTLGGLAIAIGELVDDAVVDVENILRRLRENAASSTPRAVLDVISGASQEVRSSIVYATTIIVLVFVPLFALPGIEGRLFTPLGVAYVVSILASLLTSITVTPVLSYYLLSGRTHSGDRESFVVTRLKQANRRVLGWAFGRRGLVLGSVAAAIVLAGYTASQMPRSFLPPFNEGTLVLSLQYNPGISLAESHRLGLLAEQSLAKVPEVKSVGRRTGRAELDEHAEGVHFSEIDVDLVPIQTPEGGYLCERPGLAVRAACVGCYRTADQPPPGSSAVRYSCPDRAQDLRAGYRDVAAPCRNLAPAPFDDPGPGRSPGREAGADPSGTGSGRSCPRRTSWPDAGCDHTGARYAVQRPEGLPDRRRQSPLRRRDAPFGAGPLNHGTTKSAHPNRSGIRPAERFG